MAKIVGFYQTFNAKTRHTVEAGYMLDCGCKVHTRDYLIYHMPVADLEAALVPHICPVSNAPRQSRALHAPGGRPESAPNRAGNDPASDAPGEGDPETPA